MIADASKFEWDYKHRAERAAEWAEYAGISIEESLQQLTDHDGVPMLGVHGFEDSPVNCFICGERLTVPFVFWAGCSRIGLHSGCAFHLANGLLRDVNEMTIGKPEADRIHQQTESAYRSLVGEYRR